jgi:hypothetical protein
MRIIVKVILRMKMKSTMKIVRKNLIRKRMKNKNLSLVPVCNKGD